MRCSPAGMIASSLEEAEDLGQRTAEVTHNHPEGIKAARVTAGLVYLGREGRSMDELRAYAEAVYEVPTCDAIRSWYEFDETCQGTMPAVFAAFFDSSSFVSMSAGAQPRTVLPTLRSSNSTSYCSRVRSGYIL